MRINHRRYVGLTTLGALLLVILLAIPAWATSPSESQTCPDGNGWVKVEGLSGLTYTFTPPDGFEVAENCMKVGDHPPMFGFGPTVTNTTLTNQNGQLQDISHASFKLVPVTTTTQPTRTTTLPNGVALFIEGYCIVNQDGVGLAYMDFGPIAAATFTINGVVYDSPPTFGIDAQFGVNVWSVVAKPGFTLGGPTSGEFTINECGTPGTTTTTTTLVGPTDPSAPITMGDIPPIIPDNPTTVAPVDPSAPVETLPFTGPEGAVGLGVAGAALLALGGLLVRGFKAEE